MSIDIELMTAEEIEAAAGSILAELESRTGRSFDSGRDFRRQMQGALENDRAYFSGDESSDFDLLTEEKEENPEKGLSSDETWFLRELIGQVRQARGQELFRDSLPQPDRELIAELLGGGVENSGDSIAAVSRKKQAMGESVRMETVKAAARDYSEITGESGIEMDRLSRFFDRDSRRYNSAFERY